MANEHSSSEHSTDYDGDDLSSSPIRPASSSPEPIIHTRPSATPHSYQFDDSSSQIDEDDGYGFDRDMAGSDDMGGDNGRNESISGANDGDGDYYTLGNDDDIEMDDENPGVGPRSGTDSDRDHSDSEGSDTVDGEDLFLEPVDDDEDEEDGEDHGDGEDEGTEDDEANEAEGAPLEAAAGHRKFTVYSVK